MFDAVTARGKANLDAQLPLTSPPASRNRGGLVLLVKTRRGRDPPGAEGWVSAAAGGAREGSARRREDRDAAKRAGEEPGRQFEKPVGRGQPGTARPMGLLGRRGGPLVAFPNRSPLPDRSRSARLLERPRALEVSPG
jgi:hypothetical protein